MPTLKLLLQNIIETEIIPDVKISGLALNSREVKKDFLFFAYQGQTVDGKKFIDQAIAQGAAAIICDSKQNQPNFDQKNGIPIIAIPNLTELIGIIAANFYQHPSRKMSIIGITGTNGKTSTSYLLAHALQKLGHKVGLIGTLGFGAPDNLTPLVYTSPNPILLQNILHQFNQQDVDTVITEVSSHALDQNRFAGVEIKAGTFTNLTHDHLDYHQTMEEYSTAKQKLFTMPSLQYGIFNLDDPVGFNWLQKFKHDFTALGYTLKSAPNEYTIAAQNIETNANGITAQIISPHGTGELRSSLIGRFNLANLLAVIGNLILLGYDLNAALEIIPTLTSVPGRMQVLGGKNKPLVIVDFSHTPDALQQALQTIREHCRGKLLCLFGCGGDRDRDKRPKMAAIAEQLSDKVIVTNDNVRFENPQQIADDILSGFARPQQVLVELDRAKAIKLAIQQAQPQDIILLAGKGHEPYQIIGDRRVAYSDVETVKLIYKSY